MTGGDGAMAQRGIARIWLRECFLKICGLDKT